jgi:choline dehydrogenase-like flavoprotein
MTMVAFDYIIADGGAGGCVLADRLAEDLDDQVLLLKCGGAGTRTQCSRAI